MALDSLCYAHCSTCRRYRIWRSDDSCAAAAAAAAASSLPVQLIVLVTSSTAESGANGDRKTRRGLLVRGRPHRLHTGHRTPHVRDHGRCEPAIPWPVAVVATCFAGHQRHRRRVSIHGHLSVVTASARVLDWSPSLLSTDRLPLPNSLTVPTPRSPDWGSREHCTATRVGDEDQDDASARRLSIIRSSPCIVLLCVLY
jgi:hypothetical protein